MKDNYLNELREKLIEANVSNVDEIVKKYQKRYDFGLESGLSEEEIEDMLGNIDDIVNLNSKEACEKHDFKESFGDMKISIETVSDNVLFEKGNDTTIHVYFENIDEASYDIKKSENEIKIEYINKKFFGLNRRRPGRITVSIPDDMKFDSIRLSTVSGDLKSTMDLISKNMVLDMVSGDSEFSYLKTNEFKAHVVAGDLEIGTLDTKFIEINTVSGDTEIEKLYADDLKADTISGDVEINEANHDMRVRSSSITGSIKINGQKYKNFENKMKEGF